MNIKYQSIFIGISFILLTYSCAPVTYEDYTPAEWDTIEYSRSEIMQYLDSHLHTLNPVEGIWNYSEEVYKRLDYMKQEYNELNQNIYEIAIIKKDLTSEREFYVMILSSVDPAWNFPGRVKGEFVSTAYPKQYAVKWYDKRYELKTSNFTIDSSGILSGVFHEAGGWGEYNSKVTFYRLYPPFTETLDK